MRVTVSQSKKIFLMRSEGKFPVEISEVVGIPLEKVKGHLKSRSAPYDKEPCIFYCKKYAKLGDDINMISRRIRGSTGYTFSNENIRSSITLDKQSIFTIKNNRIVHVKSTKV